VGGKDDLVNVYTALFSGTGHGGAKGGTIATTVEEQSISSKAGDLTVDCYIVNRLIYKEVVVTATREFEVPIDLSFIFFPKTIPITVTSTAVVQNGDEFVRNIDMASDFVDFILDQFGLTDLRNAIGAFGARVIHLFK
jgi:preprotein translocase subunit Sec63